MIKSIVKTSNDAVCMLEFPEMYVTNGPQLSVIMEDILDVAMIGDVSSLRCLKSAWYF